MADVFPDDIKRFITENINSVEQLEVLLLLRGDPARRWCAEEISQAISSVPTSVAQRLADLHAAGLLQRTEGAPPHYRFAPASAGKETQVAQLAELYKERRVAVITLIYSRPGDQVQAFANAFKLRKDQ